MSGTIENGIIERTMLGYEDHGILIFSLTLKFAGTGQGFGGWCLDGVPRKQEPGAQREPTVFCGAAVAGLLRAVGVDSWEKLKGAHVRVRRDDDYGPIRAIGHIIEDKWFDPGAAFDAMRLAQGMKP